MTCSHLLWWLLDQWSIQKLSHLLELCHHCNTQERIHSPCFKQMCLVASNPLLLYILSDLLFSRDTYQWLRWYWEYKWFISSISLLCLVCAISKNQYEVKLSYRKHCVITSSWYKCHTLISSGDHLFGGMRPSLDNFEVLDTHR